MNNANLIPRTLASLLLFAAAVAPLIAQTIELRSGEVVIGRVLDVDDDAIRVEVMFPNVVDRSIPRAEIEPRSIYALLAARIDQDDAKSHLVLAATCRKLGLFALAIAEARAAARRDPSYATNVQSMIKELRKEIAAEVLQHAETDFADDHMGSARIALHVVLRDYEDTPAAKSAKQLLAKIAARVGPEPRVVTAEKIEPLVAAVRRELERTEKATSMPVRGSVREQHAMKAAIDRLEKSWQTVDNLVGPSSEVSVPSGETAASNASDRLSSAQADLRQRLTGAYLSLGSIYLQRRALPDAEDWCNKAYELDPESHDLDRLHDLIIQAKIIGGWRY